MLVVTLFCAAACGQVVKDRPLLSAPAAVQFLYPQNVNIAARHAERIDLHFRVADGLHINSHVPMDKFLIPARLAVVEAQGLNVIAVDFPPGTEYALQFSPKEKLSVYTGEFVLHAHLIAQPGEHLLQGALRYQACDSNSCMPPNSIPVSVTVVSQ
jgi:Disulphide bond corrector protein DsbC